MTAEVADLVLEILESHMEQHYNRSSALHGNELLDRVNELSQYRITAKALADVLFWLVEHDFVRVDKVELPFGSLLVYRLNDDQEEVQRRRMKRVDLMGRVMAHAFVDAMEEVASADR